MRSNNETDGVALPESVPIHLMIVTDITFTKQQTCIMPYFNRNNILMHSQI